MARAHVMIIEARSEDDYYEDRLEGRALREAFHIYQIPVAYREVLSSHHFARAISEADRSSVAYVHVSAHADAEGIGFPVGDGLSWREFEALAWPKLRGKCLTFSSCLAGRGVAELYSLHKTFCNAIIAPTRVVSWDEALAAYSAFYFRATREDGTTKQDVELMNRLVGAGTFRLFTSPSRSDTFVIGS